MSGSLVQKIQLTTVSLVIFLAGLSLVLLYVACCALDWLMASPDHLGLASAVPDLGVLNVFPVDIGPLQAWSHATARQSGGYHYVVSYSLVALLLLAGILARYRFQSLISRSERVKAFAFYLLFSSSLLVYTVFLPTVFFAIHLDQLEPITDQPIHLHDLQLFILDQIARSLFFDFLEALRVPWSNLDYSEDADLAFRALVGLYRFMIPAALLFVFFPLRQPGPKPKDRGEPGAPDGRSAGPETAPAAPALQPAHAPARPGPPA